MIIKWLTGLLALTCTYALAMYVSVWTESQGGTIYLDYASITFSGPVSSGNPYLRATIFTNYQSAINSDRVCYPSGRDCQWKRLNTTVVLDFSCNNIVRLVSDSPQWDDGPTSQSFDRSSYAIPDARAHAAKPGPVPPGGIYAIANDRPMLYVQAIVCKAWPTR